MKKILVILFLSLSFSISQAQNTFAKGDAVIDAGIGVGSFIYSGSGYTNRMPVVFTSLDLGIIDNLFNDKSSLGVGGYLAYTSAKWGNGEWGWKYSDVLVGARGNLHYQFVDKLDTYASLILGYDFSSAKATGNHGTGHYEANGNSLAYSITVGARYYFSDNFAAMAELGVGMSVLNIGVSYKF